jgi:transposase-like protein
MEKFEKMRRRFSTDFKKEKVKLIDEGKIRVSELSRMYEVSSTSIYKWMMQYSTKYTRSERIVVEKISEELKTKEHLNRIAELEKVVGQQYLQLLYKDQIIKTASEEYGEDIEKKFKS